MHALCRRYIKHASQLCGDVTHPIAEYKESVHSMGRLPKHQANRLVLVLAAAAAAG